MICTVKKVAPPVLTVFYKMKKGIAMNSSSPVSHDLFRSARRWLPLCILIPALLAAILMLVAFFTQYDAPQANYFRAGASLPVIAGILAGLSALIGTAAAFTLPRTAPQTQSLPLPGASLNGVIGFLACSAFLVLSLIRDRFDWMLLLTLALSLCSAVYCILVAFFTLSREHTRDIAVPLGFTPIFATIFLCASHYFDKSLEMNAPVKVILMLGLLTAMITFTGEIRYHVGSALPRVYLMMLSWSIAAGSLSFLAVPAAAFAGILSGYAYLASSFVILGCTVSSALRLWTLLRALPETPEADGDSAGADGENRT